MSISARSAALISIASQYITLLLQFASTMVLARLLTPEDIGIYSAGFSIVIFAHLFRDFGLNQYVIQEKSLDEVKIRTTFTISLMIAWVLGVAVYLAANPAAKFFGEQGIEQLMHLLAINFFLIPFGSITLALLRKKLKFHITAGIGFVSVLIGTTTAIWTAYEGANYLSLAYGALAETGSTVLISVFFRPKGLKLGLCLQGFKKIFHFGAMVGSGNIVTQLSTSLTDILIARLLGLSALGFFSRAFGTFSLFEHIFAGSIRPLILPFYSHVNNEPGELTSAYLTTTAYSFVFAWPFFGFLFLYTEEVIRVLYGSQWDAAIPLVKILCISGIFLPPTLFIDNLFIASGRPDITLKIQLVSNAAKIIFILIASFFGLEAICFALVGFFVIKLLISLNYANTVLCIKYQKTLIIAKQALPCLCSTLVSCAIAEIIISYSVENTFIQLSVITGAGALGWVFGLVTSEHSFCNELKKIYNQINPYKRKTTG